MTFSGVIPLFFSCPDYQYTKLFDVPFLPALKSGVIEGLFGHGTAEMYCYLLNKMHNIDTYP